MFWVDLCTFVSTFESVQRCVFGFFWDCEFTFFILWRFCSNNVPMRGWGRGYLPDKPQKLCQYPVGHHVSRLNGISPSSFVAWLETEVASVGLVVSLLQRITLASSLLSIFVLLKKQKNLSVPLYT